MTSVVGRALNIKYLILSLVSVSLSLWGMVYFVLSGDFMVLMEICIKSMTVRPCYRCMHLHVGVNNQLYVIILCGHDVLLERSFRC